MDDAYFANFGVATRTILTTFRVLLNTKKSNLTWYPENETTASSKNSARFELLDMYQRALEMGENPENVTMEAYWNLFSFPCPTCGVLNL